MYRKITEELNEWKNSPSRKPLLLSGARQTGKTYIIDAFAKDNYDNCVKVNFERQPAAKRLFEEDLDPKNIITRLENYTGQRILPEKTLIFFDEIQACPAAVTSFKYFCEDANEYHIIGAGSLLGVAINRNFNDKKFSFPVGKVDEFRLFPMDFEEFLIAKNETILLETIQDHYNSNEPLDEVIHNKALSLYRDYLTIGGMPEAVQEFINTGSFVAADKKISNIYNDYVADTAKYTTKSEAIKCKECYSSIVGQLLKPNKNFKYTVVKDGKNAQYYSSAIDWLINAGIAHKSKLLDTARMPLEYHTSDKLFRIYLSDVGLFRNKVNIRLNNIQDIKFRDDMTGILAENYVACELASYNIPLYYWCGKKNSEIEFMVEFDGFVTPIEVKAGKRVSGESLEVYKNNNKLKTVFRVSQKNFGLTNGIKSVPLYAVYCIAKDIVEHK